MSLRRRLGLWLNASLSRRLLATLALVLVGVSLPVLGLVTAYHLQRIEAEQQRAADAFNSVIEAALQEAQIHRDVPALQSLLDGIAAGPSVVSLRLWGQDGQLHLADAAAPPLADLPAAARALAPGASLTQPASGEGGQRLLRAIRAVPNGAACAACHGPVAEQPVAGFLMLDYAGGALAGDVRLSAVMLALLGVAVTLAASGAVWLVIRQSVLRPVAELTAATRAFRDGAPGISLQAGGQDEIAGLRRSFATMADEMGATLARLHSSEDRLQAILDAIPDAIRVVDADYRIVKANAAYAAQVGQPLEQVLGQACYRSSHRRDSPCPPTMVCCPLAEIRANSGPLTCRQTHFAADGHEMHVEVAAALVDLGTATAPQPCIVEAIRDLDRQAQLSQEHRLAELGLLAAGLGHEIFNPLSSISLVAGAIEQDAGAGDMQRLGEHLATLRAEVGRTLTLTNSLLTLCQPPGEKQFIDLSQVIPQTLELLGFKLREANVALVTDIRPGLWVIASESDLRMSLSNIVLNGMHAMPGGGALTVNARRQGDEIRIEVIDAGHGIAAEDLRRILLPFWTRRADGSRGSGLGLPLVLGAMERARGRLDVESIPGVGSRFTLVFPAPEVRQ